MSNEKDERTHDIVPSQALELPDPPHQPLNILSLSLSMSIESSFFELDNGSLLISRLGVGDRSEEEESSGSGICEEREGKEVLALVEMRLGRKEGEKAVPSVRILSNIKDWA